MLLLVSYANCHPVATYQSISYLSEIRLHTLPYRWPGTPDLPTGGAQTIGIHLAAGQSRY